MPHFENIAEVVKTYRKIAINEETGKNYSQLELSQAIGYSNGQFISNVERGLCSIPLNNIKRLCGVLNIPDEIIKLALINDYTADITEKLNVQTNTRTKPNGRHLN